MTATLKLYEIADQLQAVAEQLVDNGGELTPELEAQLTALEGAFDTKVERVLLYARNLLATAQAAKGEAARLADLAGTRERAAERLREYVKQQMELADVTKVETSLIVARIQQNSRPSIRWIEGPLPADFTKVITTLDGEKAYETWKRDGALPAGFTVERGSHLRVK